MSIRDRGAGKEGDERFVAESEVVLDASSRAESGELSVLSDKKIRSERRKHLDERLRSLYQRAMVIERELIQLADPRFYRVCIFGSARLKEGAREYEQVVRLARILASDGIDILTGGGPGLMEAANLGAQQGRKEGQSKSRSFGISIHLDFEPIPNPHLDIKRHHH